MNPDFKPNSQKEKSDIDKSLKDWVAPALARARESDALVRQLLSMIPDILQQDQKTKELP